MGLPEHISRQMSLREPQRKSLEVLDEISRGTDYKTTSLESVAALASEKSDSKRPISFDTEFPSFCFALATGVGKTRLMGASIYYLWKSKGYQNFFVLAPGTTLYDKLRAELNPAHPKYMFVGLSDLPQPMVYDGDSYLRFQAGQKTLGDPPNIFVFNIGKIFTKRETDFKFHRFHELLGDAFSRILQEMDDLVVVMDESHRYRGPASLSAINHLKPALGLEFTATPKYKDNVVYSFSLAQSIGRYIKTPTVLTRTNMTTSDAEEIETLKLLDGMTRHEQKKGRLSEYCQAYNAPLVKPFVLISTKDTKHAGQIQERMESDAFCEGRYKGKTIVVHSKQTGAESNTNIQRLLAVEQPTSNVEVVIHVNMLKEGWDVKNLYTIIPLRASISEILTEQTIGRGLRLPFGQPTGDPDLDALEIISHDQYAKLVAAAKDNPLFQFREMKDEDLRPMKTVPVSHGFVKLKEVIERLVKTEGLMFTAELTDGERVNEMVETIVAEEVARYNRRTEAEEPAEGFDKEAGPMQGALFDTGLEEAEVKPFDPNELAKELKEGLAAYARANIDVPMIIAEASTDRELEPFEIRVNIGPFELVDQHILTRELASGQERRGERVDVMEVENPRAFLAGRLIDAVEELDVTNDKETALACVDAYLAQIDKPAEELPKLVHLYRDPIINDLKVQIEEHLQDNTQIDIHVRRGFVLFQPYSKTILEKDGTVNYKESVPKADVRRYLFDGFNKSFYSQVPFDVTPEKDFATILEKDDTVIKWIRPPDGNVPITYRGRTYNPDFIVETKDKKLIVEIKARNKLRPTMDNEVREKTLAAIRWCEAASNIEGASKPWEYKLVPDDIIEPTRDLPFVLSQSIKI